MRLFAGLIPHSRLSGRTQAAAATNSTGFVAVSAVSQTVKGSMKNISCNNHEQLEDSLSCCESYAIQLDLPGQTLKDSQLV
jgi:hypothetical protein